MEIKKLMKKIMIATHVFLLLVIIWQDFALSVAWNDVERWHKDADRWFENYQEFKHQLNR